MKNIAKIISVTMAAAGLWITCEQMPVYAEENIQPAECILSAGSLPLTTVTKVYGDGEKVAAAIIEYPKALSSEAVHVEDFSALGKKISAVYVNDEAKLTGQAGKGRYVILEFA